MSDSVEKFLNEEVGGGVVETAAVEQPLTYRVDPMSKVPVSKHYGKLWESRYEASKSARKVFSDAWAEAIRYYNNNQQDHREGADGKAGNRYFSKRRNNKFSETENIVYANARAMMPALYAKNPQVEFTCDNEAYKEYVNKLERIVNILAQRKHAPGINLKLHAKQAVLSSELCNLGWLMVGYVKREMSVEAAQATLETLSNELADAKDMKTIRELEGKLMALEEELTVASPAGPFVKYYPADAVFVDADVAMPDFSDAKHKFVIEQYPTDYLNAKYGEKAEDGSIKSTYDPTHILLGRDSTDDEESFSIFEKNKEATHYGYKSDEALAKAHRTQCVRIFDKVTRRIYLYACNKWDWPIWVENDPYGLPGFYSLTPMFFNTTTHGAYAHSNVTYYLDQQDAVNEIHDEMRRGRQSIRESVLYDNSFDRTTVSNWIKGGDDKAYGVKVPEGKNMRDLVLEKPNPMLKALPLFDASRVMQSADRVSGVSDVMRNVQFKTNTTNKAIENYNSTTALRLDEKIDAIEDCIGQVMYNVAFLCAQFMSQEEVASILGNEAAKSWTNYTPFDLRSMFACIAIGGSTQKPTSAAKKQQALEMAQMLSQYLQFAPSVILETVLKLFDEAFDEITLPADAFDRMYAEVQQSMKRGQTDVQGEGGGEPTTEGAPSGGTSLEQVAAVVDALPPQAKEALGRAIAQGVPVSEALPEVIRVVQQTGQTQ